MNSSAFLIGQVTNNIQQPVSVNFQKPLPFKSTTFSELPQKKVATVIKKQPYEYFLNKHPNEYYNDACSKLNNINSAEELYKLCGQLLNDYIDYSMLLHKLNKESKIIKLVAEMDKYWHRFFEKIKNRPIMVGDTWDGYAHEHWYRQALANEVKNKADNATKGFKNMGWGDFSDYIIEDDNPNLVHLPRE